jgi:co-chaperonin GroES (HSP10)
MNLKPLGDRLVVEPLEREQTTPSGLVLPETAKEKPQEGEVIAVGPGRRDEDGKRIKMDVQGRRQSVLYAKYGGTEIKIDGKKLLILKESDVLAIIVVIAHYKQLKSEGDILENGETTCIFSEEARRKLKKGIDTCGKCRFHHARSQRPQCGDLDKKFGAPTITHDGVTVAKEIELEDPFENMGAQLLKEAATKTNDIAGDGTTTATVLAQNIVNEGLKNVAAGANPMLLKRGIEAGTAALADKIREHGCHHRRAKEEIASVASISAQDHAALVNVDCRGDGQSR